MTTTVGALEQLKEDIMEHRRKCGAMARQVREAIDSCLEAKTAIENLGRDYWGTTAALQGVMDEYGIDRNLLDGETRAMNYVLARIDEAIVYYSHEVDAINELMSEVFTIPERGRGYLLRKYGDILPDLRADYIEEAEHQDGPEYWEQFVYDDGKINYDALDVDIVLFAIHREPAYSAMKRLLTAAGKHADEEDSDCRAWWGGVDHALTVYDRARGAGWGLYQEEHVDTDPYFD